MSVKRFAASPALVVYAVCAGALIGYAPRQIHWDLLWQRILGESVLRGDGLPLRLGAETFTADGAPWTPQEWLFSTAFAAAHRAGMDAAFMYGVGVVAAIVLAVVAWTTIQRRGGTLAVSLAMLLTTVAMFGGLAVRAQIFGWLLFAVVMYALARHRPWWAVPAIAVWCNLHASGIVGPALVALYALGRTLEARRLDGNARSAWLAAAACGAATLATPLGWHLPAYAFTLFTSPIRAEIDEWHSVFSFPMVQFWFIAVPLAAAVVVAVARRGVSLTERLFVVALFALMVGAVRNIPLFVIAAAPLCAVLFPARETVASAERGRGLVNGGIAFAAFLAAFHVAVGGAFGPRERPPYPAAALAHVRALPGHHRALCSDFGWCSGLLGAERVRVFMDGRCDPYPPAIWAEYHQVMHAEPGWKATLAHRDIDLIITERKRLIARVLRRSDAWRVAYQDAAFVVFAKT